jgi:hypothetical protein
MNDDIETFTKKGHARMFMLDTYRKPNPKDNSHKNSRTKYAFNQTETHMEMSELSKMLLHLKGL